MAFSCPRTWYARMRCDSDKPSRTATAIDAPDGPAAGAANAVCSCGGGVNAAPGGSPASMPRKYTSHDLCTLQDMRGGSCALAVAAPTCFKAMTAHDWSGRHAPRWVRLPCAVHLLRVHGRRAGQEALSTLLHEGGTRSAGASLQPCAAPKSVGAMAAASGDRGLQG